MRQGLAEIIENINYDNYDELDGWRLIGRDLSHFSAHKTLFDYQCDAVKSITKALYVYFAGSEYTRNDENTWRLTERMRENYRTYGINTALYDVQKYETAAKEKRGIINKRFSLLYHHFTAPHNAIPGTIFLNRACFWMATASGKSMVLVKTIELIDCLMRRCLIPQRDIMLLLPRDDLIAQCMATVDEYNSERRRKIELVNLRRYDEDKRALSYGNTIKVYYYRADLLRNRRAESIIDYRSYMNNGKWYCMLDEAHRGKKGDSNLQDYITILTKNGFLFNFSATFTDAIDHITTCYNFNLEKFIHAGYGKNIYLSSSYYQFTRDTSEFSEREKQKQVLKSFIIYSGIQKSRQKPLYHSPLLMALVNSVNTKNSDLLLYFRELEKIACGNIDHTLLDNARQEMRDELNTHQKYVFGDEVFAIDSDIFSTISAQDILCYVFNARSHGKIEILEGEKGKEISLKLETSHAPFALIKIGDSSTFKHQQLGDGYIVVDSFEDKRYFERLNSSEDINLLLGSRSFYEGWDSNRPNVINLINIGKGNAKKYVLQSIGRGVRIEPRRNERKRLPVGDTHKNPLLETLFIFATDKNSVLAIIETMDREKAQHAAELSLEVNPDIPFDLLIPFYTDKKTRAQAAKFNIAHHTRRAFLQYMRSFSRNTFMLKTGVSPSRASALLMRITQDEFFQINDSNIYSNMDDLLDRIINHASIGDKIVDRVDQLGEEIIHFKRIPIPNLTDEEARALRDKIDNIIKFYPPALSDEQKQAIAIVEDIKGAKMGIGTGTEKFKDVTIRHIAQHYFIPLMYSERERIDYMRHIITVPSEVAFIQRLDRHIGNAPPPCDWMFSKIDESVDAVHIPYFHTIDNVYRKFYPDFVFWLKQGAKYKILFVDPKGAQVAAYQNKVDEFERLFIENNAPRVFRYKNIRVTFELKLITEDINAVGEKYRPYWNSRDDFSFLRVD